jgi:hypothetical protein
VTVSGFNTGARMLFFAPEWAAAATAGALAPGVKAVPIDCDALARLTAGLVAWILLRPAQNAFGDDGDLP